MSKVLIRLGGVPEHFNLPIHLAAEKGFFDAQGIDLSWTTFTGGTGQMTKALRDGEVDACILLTEGIIKDIIAGNKSKIISGYVNTPLIWGIHTGTKNTLEAHHQIYDHQYAISRFGSGSHLMAIVDATVNDRKIDEEQFTIIKNLEGALESLHALETDVFYWEKYTTKPYVDSGILRRIGEFLTPWPCFVMAASNDIISREPEALGKMLHVIHRECFEFMEDDRVISEVSRRYEQKMLDVERWYHSTEWATHGWVSNKMLKSVVHNLKVAGIVKQNADLPELVWRR